MSGRCHPCVHILPLTVFLDLCNAWSTLFDAALTIFIGQLSNLGLHVVSEDREVGRSLRHARRRGIVDKLRRVPAFAIELWERTNSSGHTAARESSGELRRLRHIRGSRVLQHEPHNRLPSKIWECTSTPLP